MRLVRFFFFNDTATTEIYTLSLHDALPILTQRTLQRQGAWELLPRPPTEAQLLSGLRQIPPEDLAQERRRFAQRSEEHTSELQSQSNLVCRLLLEKKKITTAAERPYFRRP